MKKEMIYLLIGFYILGFATASVIEAVKDYNEIVRKLEQIENPPTYKFLDEDYYHPYEYQKKQNEIRIQRDSIVEQQIQKVHNGTKQTIRGDKELC